MKKLYDNKPVLFAVIWIVIYVVGFGSAGIQFGTAWLNYAVQSGAGLVILGFLLLFARKHDLLAEWGFTGVQTSVKRMLFYIPMLLACTENLWCGFGRREDSPLATALGILAIGVIGPVLEELILRSILFQAIARRNTRQAFWFAALSFGVGHLVNLFYGREVAATLLQVVYACCVGFCFTAVLYTGNSLLPTVLGHILFNTLSFFAKQDAAQPAKTISVTVMCVLFVGYGCYTLYMHRTTHPLKAEPLHKAS
ncbi:MAG: CPBP family intramembrane metalloprotease [Oscillospiraceae bacterium]|nr:CPBP family intramembrane metalloprotease [Oscillospiraceae bacterium]